MIYEIFVIQAREPYRPIFKSFICIGKKEFNSVLEDVKTRYEDEYGVYVVEYRTIRSYREIIRHLSARVLTIGKMIFRLIKHRGK